MQRLVSSRAHVQSNICCSIAALLCANDVQIVAPGSKFHHRPAIPERWPFEARLEEPSLLLEAMNFSGMGHAEYDAVLGLSPHALRIGAIGWNNPVTKWTDEACFIRVPGPN
jgi:hypothetical protein